MNKYIVGSLLSIIVAIIGLVLLVEQTLSTPSVGVNVGAIPPIGILYSLIFAIGVIAAIALMSLNTPTRAAPPKK
ncbi:MAG: hypothetical protein ACP5OC_00880 [Thermoplasmata archaeon]